MRFLIRIIPLGQDREAFLSLVRSLSANLYVQARNPKWTSYGALELDLFARSKGDLELCVSALEPLGKIEFARDLNEPPRYAPPEDAVREARTLFNAERYWESHEVLEGVWRTLQGEEKSFVQGVILVCAAFVHHQKGEERVAVGVLKRAEKQLTYGNEEFFGIEVRLLRKQVRKTLDSGVFARFRI